MPTLGDRLLHAWNAFTNKDPTYGRAYGPSSSLRPDRVRFTRGNERSIVTSVYNRIAIDCAAIKIEHIKLDDNGRFIEEIDDGLNYCLTTEANIDQTGRAFIQDAVQSMMDEGCIAIVPVEADINPTSNNSYDIRQIRTAKIMEWYPAHVKLRLYNEKTGNREEIILPKKTVAIIENPLFAVMNEPNSTLQRLIKKLSLLDYVDEQNGAGKLDLIIQLPYVVKTEARRQQAENRRKDIEMQLTGSKYGIAYTDGTEHITQLNRAVESQLLPQIETLTRMLYSQLGLTEEIMNGTADEKALNNYYNRTIEPIMSAIVDEMKRKFLTKTARTKKHSIQFFRDPFKLVPTTDLAELADKFTRNEIMTSNEFRQIIGMKPSAEPTADELRNKNMPIQDEGMAVQEQDQFNTDQVDYDNQVSQLDDLDGQLDELEAQLGHSLESDPDFFMHYASKYYDPVKAHEYYEEYTKKKRLKGYDKSGKPTEYSTSMLNDQGKMAYKQIKESLAAEKKNTIDGSRASTNAQIKANQENLKSQVEANNSAMKSEIEAKKTEMQKNLDTHANTMMNSITSIKDKILSAKKQGNKALMNSLSTQIDKLREENAKKRAELNAAYQNSSAQLRTNNQNTNATLREGNKGVAEGLRAGHKQISEKAREDYKTKTKDELKRLVDSGEFKATKKRKKQS